MKSVLLKSFIKSGLRERETLFWVLLFPLILFTIMVLIFSNMGGEDLSFNMVLMDRSGEGMGTTVMDQVLEGISSSTGNKNALFNIREMSDEQKALELLKEQKTDLIVTIPEDFNQQFNKVVFFSKLSRIEAEDRPTVEIDRVAIRDTSKMSGDIMEQIISQVNFEAAKRMGIKLPEVDMTNRVVGQSEEFNYADYFFAGVLVMAFFSTGLFNMGINLTLFKQRKIFKRFSATPLSKSQLMSSAILSNLFFMMIAFGLLLIYAKVFYSVTWNIFRLKSILYMLLTAGLAISFGYFVSAVSKTPNSASGFANVLFFPMQFLGGLYFPVFDLSPVVLWFVYINPITYVAAGMRESMGLMESPLPNALHYVVPLIWICGMLLISLWRFRWDGDA